jgi:ketopantoate reductase
LTDRGDKITEVRFLVLGAGVIGSVYAARLLETGHQVTLVARGRRLDDLRSHGLADQGRELETSSNAPATGN